MTDKQQPSTVPERIWIDINAPQTPGYYFLKRVSGIPNIEYARVHPVDEARVGEIVERQRKRKEAFATWKARDIIPDSLPVPEAITDIDELLTLLPQLSSSEKGKPDEQ